MEDKDTIQNFGDMVNATEKMAAPWRETLWKVIRALIITNILWAVIVGMLVWFAYMTPVDVGQEQNFEQQTQTQNYSEGVTDGG